MPGMGMSSRIEGRGLLFISLVGQSKASISGISTVPTPLFMKKSSGSGVAG